MFPWNPYNPYFPCLWKQSSDFRVFFFIHAKKGNTETKETKDNMTLPFYKFEFLFMQWREIRKLRKIRIENVLSFDSLKSLFSLENNIFKYIHGAI